MDSSWSAFPGDSSANRQQRYPTNVLQPSSSTAQHSRETQQPPQLAGVASVSGTAQQPPYQAYHGASSAGTLPAVTSPITRLDSNSDYNMDVQMQDADQYNRAKYQGSRQPYLGSEESSTSQRYSPMNTSVVGSQQTPYSAAPPPAQQASYSQIPAYQSRQSPSRPNYSSGSQSYYSQTATASPRTSAPPSMQSYQHPLQQQQSASGFFAPALLVGCVMLTYIFQILIPIVVVVATTLNPRPRSPRAPCLTTSRLTTSHLHANPRHGSRA